MAAAEEERRHERRRHERRRHGRTRARKRRRRKRCLRMAAGAEEEEAEEELAVRLCGTSLEQRTGAAEHWDFWRSLGIAWNCLEIHFPSDEYFCN